MTNCPKCGKFFDTYDSGYYYCECGHCWAREPEPLVKTFPYPLGATLYTPDKFNGKLVSVEKYEVMGYYFDERGTWARMKPLSYDGTWTDWRVPLTGLYLTESEARKA